MDGKGLILNLAGTALVFVENAKGVGGLSVLLQLGDTGVGEVVVFVIAGDIFIEPGDSAVLVCGADTDNAFCALNAGVGAQNQILIFLVIGAN